jgi:tetratricopeptide (TPR) repeat protein
MRTVTFAVVLLMIGWAGSAHAVGCLPGDVSVSCPSPAPPPAANPYPSPALADASVSSGYELGMEDWDRLRDWFGSQTGDRRAGADYWATNRSSGGQRSCSEAAQSYTLGDRSAFAAGCADAKSRLDPIDAKRLNDPSYRAGFNDKARQVPIEPPVPAPQAVPPSSLAAVSKAAQYVVDGFTLGNPIASSNSNYAAYRCAPSDDFAASTYCQRSQQISGTLGNAIATYSLIHDQNKTPLYIMANVAPVASSKPMIESEIDKLSNVIGSTPKEVTWMTPDSNGTTGVIVTWGDAKLEKLRYTETDILSRGESPHVGILIDFGGDLRASAKAFNPVFRIIGGGPGYVYAAGLDATGRGHRHYIAIDPSQIAARQFEKSLTGILQRDRLLAATDYHLWPEVAIVARKLALQTSTKFANHVLDQVFEREGSTKLRSHVWSALTLGAISHLTDGIFSRFDIYGPKTQHPQIRGDIESVIANDPSDPYIAFAYFVHGDLDKAMTANHADLFSNVLHFGAGYTILLSLLEETLHVTKIDPKYRRHNELTERLKYSLDEPEQYGHDNNMLRFFNSDQLFRDHKPIETVLPGSASRLVAAQSQFDAVVSDPSTPIADDAAYLSGWISVQLGEPYKALSSYSQAMVVGNGDYSHAALKEVVRELQEQPTEKAITILRQNKVFSTEPALWYAVARSAYRRFEFQRAIDIGEEGLAKFNVPIERLPVSTDLERIQGALERIDSKLVEDLNIRETAYLIQASREMMQYESRLDKMQSESPVAFDSYARAVIVKYSLLRDPPIDPKTGELLAPRKTAHNDYRQAAHLIELSLEKIPRDVNYTKLREWLHFRYVRVLTLFAPERIPLAIAAMQQEFPNSELLDDAIAEQVYADGIVLEDINAAEDAFQELLRQYPNGNAVDNAYSWLAIIERCAGNEQKAKELSKEIIRRFPFSRHAVYARARLAHPNTHVGCYAGQFFYSY